MRSLFFDSAAGALVVGLAVGCLMLVAALVALAKPRGAWLKNRLEPYGATGGGVAVGGSGRTSGRKSGWRPQVDRLYEATERALDDTSAGGSLERLIERAHLKVRPAQLLFWAAAAGVASAVLVSLLVSSPLLIVAAFVGGLVAPLAWVAGKGPAAPAGLRRSTARRTHDDGGLAQGGSELRPQHAGNRRRGARAGERGVREGPQRDAARAPGGRVSGGDGRPDRLGRLPLRASCR